MIIYFAHYVIARGVYGGARALGVSPFVMIAGAVVFLVLAHRGTRRVLRQLRNV